MNFHDKDYDGIVLKIPSWFIDMNDLGTAIEILTEALQNANKSMYHSDHVKNLYELENFSDKAKMVKDAADRRQAEIEYEQKRFNDVVTGVTHELVWENRTDGISNFGEYNYLNIKGQIFSESEACTKTTVKAEIQRLFKEKIKTIEDLEEFYKNNHVTALAHDLPGANADLLDLQSLNLYYSKTGWGGIGISYRRLYIKFDWHQNKNKSWVYRTCPLVLIDGQYGINQHYQLPKAIMLDPAYYKSGMALRKPNEKN